MEFSHIPVLLEESINGLNIKPNGIYVDGTAGGAGHSIEIAKLLSDKGRIIALDRDPNAVEVASERLSKYNATVVRSNYSEIKDVLATLNINKVDGMLMDLGVSSYQLDTPERGFSYHNDAPLDMRMSQEGMSAKDIVNEFSEQQIMKILFEYGEEKFARRIASNIVKLRMEKTISTTLELAEIIKQSVPASVRREKNPCKKTFQAIRIAVNGELDHLSDGLDNAFSCLNTGGRLAIITFHSLEDRLVKQRFTSWTKGCVCHQIFHSVLWKSPRKLINRNPLRLRKKNWKSTIEAGVLNLE